MAEHTPTPWIKGALPHTISAPGRCDVVSCEVFSSIVDCLETFQADEYGREWCCEGTPEANRDFILSACNSHQKALDIAAALPLNVSFEDASDFKDNAAAFMRAMKLAREFLALTVSHLPSVEAL